MKILTMAPIDGLCIAQSREIPRGHDVDDTRATQGLICSREGLCCTEDILQPSSTNPPSMLFGS